MLRNGRYVDLAEHLAGAGIGPTQHINLVGAQVTGEVRASGLDI